MIRSCVSNVCDRSIVISYGKKKAQNKCEQNGFRHVFSFPVNGATKLLKTHKVSNVKVAFVNMQINFIVTLT